MWIENIVSVIHAYEKVKKGDVIPTMESLDQEKHTLVVLHFRPIK